MSTWLQLRTICAQIGTIATPTHHCQANKTSKQNAQFYQVRNVKQNDQDCKMLSIIDAIA